MFDSVESNEKLPLELRRLPILPMLPRLPMLDRFMLPMLAMPRVVPQTLNTRRP